MIEIIEQNLDLLYFFQTIFGCKILREIYKDSLIINIDESWFSRSVKSQNFIAAKE